MWHALERRWSARVVGISALALLVWVGLGVLSFDRGLSSKLIAMRATLLTLGLVWFYQRVQASLDLRETRTVLHLALPLSLRQVGLVRVLDPVPTTLLGAAWCVLGSRVVVHWSAGPGLPASSIAGMALLALALEGSNILFEEVQLRYKGRRLPTMLGLAAVGLLGLGVGMLGARFAKAGESALTVLEALLASPTILLSLLGIAVVLSFVTFRMFVDRDDWVATTCGW